LLRETLDFSKASAKVQRFFETTKSFWQKVSILTDF